MTWVQRIGLRSFDRLFVQEICQIMPEQPDPSAPPSPVEEASKDSSAPSGTRQSVVGISSSSSASSSKAKPLESPEYSIPGHDMLRELNRGGMGAVYKARQHGFNRIVAVKVILPERLQAGEATKRFGREVRAAALLHHPNFVMVFQTDLAGPVAFLTMEYVDGIDLSRLVKLTGPLPIQLAVSFIVQAADALQHAADKGVIHRDIKPSNLMVTPSPVKGLKEVPKPLPSTTSAGSIKILDLGLARILGDGEGDEAGVEENLGAGFLRRKFPSCGLNYAPNCPARSRKSSANKSNSSRAGGTFGCSAPRSNARCTYPVRSPASAALRRSPGCVATSITCSGSRLNSSAALR
jgi:serine/threonine protein kinase